ncbi:unnamed protein product, partial [Laminaria digitata]
NSADESSDVDVGGDATTAAAAAVVVEPSAACHGDGAVGDRPTLHRPEYRIYKIETPDHEDPKLEVVVALSSKESGATPATAPASGSTAPPPPANRPRPSVRVLPDGRGIVVDPPRSSKGVAVQQRLLSL